jgi:hypothetical protein
LDAPNKYSAGLDKIVDVTIAYPGGNPLGLLDILSAWREPCTTHVHYKIYDINQVGLDSILIIGYSFKPIINKILLVSVIS